MTALARLGPLLGREVLWWGGGAARLGWRVKGQLLLAVLVGSLVLVWGGWHTLRLLGLPPLTVAVLLALWARIGPVSFARSVGVPRWRWQTRRRLRRRWLSVMTGAGLGRHQPEGLVVPALARSRWDRRGLLHLTPALLVGQTVEDVEHAADRLRTAAGAHRLRVVPNPARTGCELVCAFGDPLTQPFTPPVPEPVAAVVPVPERPVLGRTEDGEPWTVDLRVCTLTAGSSGSGKGSVMWSLMLALAPAVRAGLVEVHGIDLKGGMELGLGRPLFTRYADRADQAVRLLEEAVTACEARANRMAGVSRLHTPSTAEPLIVVLIDELATLTAYLPDRDLLRRGEAALARLCSIGRAPGFVVWGFLQDPRKETIKARHLFTQTIGLRLRDREEVAMILGDGALNAGAACHQISRSTPGVGYALDETGRLTRVRAGWVHDDTIRHVAASFPAARQQPVIVPDPADGPAASRPRSPRSSTRTPRARTDQETAV